MSVYRVCGWESRTGARGKWEDRALSRLRCEHESPGNPASRGRGGPGAG